MKITAVAIWAAAVAHLFLPRVLCAVDDDSLSLREFVDELSKRYPFLQAGGDGSSNGLTARDHLPSVSQIDMFNRDVQDFLNAYTRAGPGPGHAPTTGPSTIQEPVREAMITIKVALYKPLVVKLTSETTTETIRKEINMEGRHFVFLLNNRYPLATNVPLVSDKVKPRSEISVKRFIPGDEIPTTNQEPGTITVDVQLSRPLQIPLSRQTTAEAIRDQLAFMEPDKYYHESVHLLRPESSLQSQGVTEGSRISVHYGLGMSHSQ